MEIILIFEKNLENTEVISIKTSSALKLSRGKEQKLINAKKRRGRILVFTKRRILDGDRECELKVET